MPRSLAEENVNLLHLVPAMMTKPPARRAVVVSNHHPVARESAGPGLVVQGGLALDQAGLALVQAVAILHLRRAMVVRFEVRVDQGWVAQADLAWEAPIWIGNGLSSTIPKCTH